MEEPPKQSVLRDYFGSGGLKRTTVLVDWVGEPEGASVAYRLGGRIVRANNDFINGITGIPGQFRENWGLLKDPEQRKLLARALMDASLLTNQRRRAILSMLLYLSLFIWVVVGVVLAVVNRDALVDFQSGYALFFYSLATSLFLPTPFEIILGNAVENIGVLATVLIASVAKVVGAWLVLLAGDKASEGLNDLLSRRPKLDHAWQRVVAFAQRYGYSFVFVMFAIPFMSDTAPLFLLAVLNLRKGLFLAITFIAIVIRSLLYIYAGQFFVDLVGSLF
ncbi:MAG: VTT domain-containing protein [Thermoplasmatota archaeon]